jgi:hypothetical protein
VTTSLREARLATAAWPVVFPSGLVSHAPWTRIHSHRANHSLPLGYRPAGSSNSLAPCIGPEMVATLRTRSFAEVGMDEVEDYSCPIPQFNPLCWSSSYAFPLKTRHVAPCRGAAVPPRWLAGAQAFLVATCGIACKSVPAGLPMELLILPHVSIISHSQAQPWLSTHRFLPCL